VSLLVLLSLTSSGQNLAFEVASVKTSQRLVGKDANNQISIGPAGLSGRNVTLKRLVIEAYHLQPHQVSGGPNWLDVNEYDIDAKAAGVATKEQLAVMLRTLLTDRFRLSFHREAKEESVYELVTDRNGPKIHPVSDGAAPAAEVAGRRHFRGDLQQFANLLSVQLTIPVMEDPGAPSKARGLPVPVLDKTGLPGIYDISVDLNLELGVDMFTLWQRVLQSQLGLKLESRKAKMEVLVVDRAERVPVGN